MHGGCLAKLLADKQGRKLVIAEIDKMAYLNAYVSQIDSNTKWKALQQVIGWLLYSQERMTDDGFGTYYLCRGWTSSYPETSGYIVPTLLRFAAVDQRKDVQEAAGKALDWLLSIQKPEGGWQSGYVHQGREAVVFNTGQVIRGMIAGYEHFKEERYLKSALKAADWIAGIQHAEGYFDKYVYLGKARVYDSYVVAPMLVLDEIIGEKRYEKVARKNIDWIIKSKQHENGWFADCDNTIKRNTHPIIHTVAYTTDGILDAGLQLKEEKYIAAAQKSANVLRDIFLKQQKLNGRYDKNWRGSEAFITTGGAQMAIVWHKLYNHTGNSTYIQAVEKMNALLTAIQQRSVHEEPNTRGALFGSFPMWGRYETFGCPNWASKYFADSLMNEAGYAGRLN